MSHPEKAAVFIQDEVKTDWHNKALWFVRQKRDTAASTVPNWEELREHASQIKLHTLSHLGDYLAEFEEKAKANGIHIHWAEKDVDHNRIVLDILKQNQVTKLVKSKSMLTEECHLNPFLEENGIEVVDTDLGERIVQLDNQPPSHIVLPAIHIRKEEVGEIFHRTIGTEEGASDPNYLTEAARQHLREKFLAAEAGLTGVNFAIAETGGFVVCTNEGNADLGASLPPVHIASMGIEKVIPRLKDLSVFTRMLARSATGQPVTTYTSHFHGPAPDQEIHVIIVDNGRSKILQSEEYIASLKCIRCGACLNTCPVYRRSGGHSYGYTIPGPIGSLLAPARDLKQHASLPFASTLCGSCSDVCPVQVNLHEQLFYRREDIVKAGLMPKAKSLAMNMAGKILGSYRAYRISTGLFRKTVKSLPSLLQSPMNTWGKQRDLPDLPEKTFKDWYKENRGK